MANISSVETQVPIRINESQTEFNSLKQELSKLDPDSITRIVSTLQNDLRLSLDALKEAEIRDWTGLLGRKGFEVALEIEINESERHGNPLSVVNIDLKKFKNINERFGHPGGNEVLSRFAKFLKDHSRRSDIVTHPYGDEFLLLLPNIDEKHAGLIVGNLVENLSNIKKSLPQGDIFQMVDMDYGIKQWTSSDTKEGFLKELDKKMFEEKRK